MSHSASSISSYEQMAEQTSALKVDTLSVAFGQTEVLKNFGFELRAGEILCLLGPSGCGKTTALKTIAGLVENQQGNIQVFGQSVQNIPAEKRGLGFIFQDYALFPHISVEKNIAYGLKGLNKEQKQQRIAEALALVELDDLGARYPHELSGGQQQRIALARALAMKPKILLMDEPFSNIDAQVKRRMMADLRKLLKDHDISCIFVTHAKEEAFAFADKTAVMLDGQIRQLDTPAKVFNQPTDTQVAGFMEAGNIASIKQSKALLDKVSIHWPKDIEQQGFWLFKPQHLELKASQQKTGMVLVDCTYIGRGYQYEISFEDQGINNWKVESETALDIFPGDTVAMEYLQQPHFLSN